MRKLFSTVSPFILPILVLVAVFALGFTVIAGVAVGLGHLLMRIFPFSLFEATALGTVFAAVTLYLIIAVFKQLNPPSISPQLMADLAENETWETDYMHIPTSRFYETESEKTWAAWLREEIANDIYIEFQDEPQAVVHLNDTQRQELAIRLSDVALSILKRKKGGRSSVTVTMTGLKRELSRMGQRAYDDRILHLALNAINMNLDYYDLILMQVIRTQDWDALADVPEE